MTVTASSFAPRINDLYETEPWATEALLRVIGNRLGDKPIWEPSAGNHKIADVLRANGHLVYTSDIQIYDRPHNELLDFFDSIITNKLARAHLITNPPYGAGNRIATRYAERALDLCPDGWIALLLTAKFDFGKTRRHLFADCPRFHGKINLVDRISWAGNGQTGTEDHAWYLWHPEQLNPLYSHAPRIFYEGKLAA